MKNSVLSFLLSLLAGALYAFSYPSFLGKGFLPFIFLALPLFLWELEKSSFKKSLLVIFGFNCGLNFIGYYWISHTLREFGQLPYLVSVFLGLLFSFILQPHWWVYAVWKKFRPNLNWMSEKNIILSAIILTLLERFITQQFPSYVGSPWIHLAPFIGLAPYFGVIIFSFMTYWISLEAIVQIQVKKMRPQVWVGLALFLVLNALIFLKNPQPTHYFPVRIVQANIGNFLKVSSEKGDKNSYENIGKTYLHLSAEEGVNGFRPDLIIWPETAYPETFYGLETNPAQIFKDIIDQTGSEILIGGYDQDTSRSTMDFVESIYNSSILISDDKVKSIYYKNILIPFGETLPFGPLNQYVSRFVPAVSLFAQGSEIPLMETRSSFRFVTPICYEILDTNYMRQLLNKWGHNHFIVNHTNDSWYGNTAEPYQHQFLSKWRAVEFSLPLIRSTNTGISSILFPDGSESEKLTINQAGRLDIMLPLSRPNSTIYQQFGAIPFFILAGLIYFLTWWRERSETPP